MFQRVYYYSGGLRLNPNLYECGKVCLSLLGTWSGKSTEMWDKKNSTMLQVLVSIQALILNARPFFNEPGYERSYVGEEGERRSRSYNEDTFILSLKTMMYTLRKPPKVQYLQQFVFYVLYKFIPINTEGLFSTLIRCTKKTCYELNLMQNSGSLALPK